MLVSYNQGTVGLEGNCLDKYMLNGIATRIPKLNHGLDSYGLIMNLMKPGLQPLTLTNTSGRCRWLGAKDWLLNVVGGYLERIKAPAKLKPFEFVDPVSDETMYL